MAISIRKTQSDGSTSRYYVEENITRLNIRIVYKDT